VLTLTDWATVASLIVTIFYSDAPIYKLVMFLCCASCCAWRLDSKGSNLGFHTCKPHANMHTGTHVAHHARLVPTLGAPRVGTDVAPHAKPMPTLDLARMLHASKTRANFCHAKVVPIVIHRLSTGCPMQNPCQLCALARLVPTLDMQKSCQCWAGGGG